MDHAIKKKDTAMFVTENEKQHLLEKYQNRRVFHGQLHDHAATGGSSDGKMPLSDWAARMKTL
jgi:streptomycin 6-kinase